MFVPPGVIAVTSPDWFIPATTGFSLIHVPTPGLVFPSDIVTVTVICSVLPTGIVELGEVTVTLTIIGIVVVVVDVVVVVGCEVVVVVVGVVGDLQNAKNKIKRESADPKHRFIIPSSKIIILLNKE